MPKILLIIAICLLSACASSSGPIGEWQDGSLRVKPATILVIGAFDRSTLRRVYEDMFVAEIETHKIKAIPSYTLVTTELVLSRKSIQSAILREGLEAILIVRFVTVKEGQAYQPPTESDYYRSYHSYYEHASQQAKASLRGRLLTLESNLYDTGTRKLIWSMQSETLEASTPRHFIEQIILNTINTISARGLIPSL